MDRPTLYGITTPKFEFEFVKEDREAPKLKIRKFICHANEQVICPEVESFTLPTC